MRIAGHRGTRLQAPENSRQALISAYTAGADVLEFDVQLTADDRLVVSHDGNTNRLTGEAGNILALTLQDLRHTSGKYDFSATFNPTDVSEFSYYRRGRRLQIEIFDDILDYLPTDIEKLIELKHDSMPDDATRRRFVGLVVGALQERGMITNTVVYSKDPEALKLCRQLVPQLRIAAFDWELSGADQLILIEETIADGLVTSIRTIIDRNGNLTKTGHAFEEYFRRHSLQLGAILYPFQGPGVETSFTEVEFRALEKLDFVWSVSTDTLFEVEVEGQIVDVNSLLDRHWNWINEPFNGQRVNRDLWSLGYAKSHRSHTDNAYVFQDDGIHIEIPKYEGWLPPDRSHRDRTIARVESLEYRMLYAEKSWPFYTGGGVGLAIGISGDFAATVDYELADPLSQASTLEMAVLNVDPGAHRSERPTSFRHKDSFFDPHGAPPYVGVEHDEDDGYRINWNLGTEYDNNQYGPPVGDGKTPTRGTLRLERRGAWFAAYYQNDDVSNWICVGVVRNQSLNDVVHLRCVAKRWRQEMSDNPSQHWPIPDNKFSFRNLVISRRRGI